MEKEKLFSIQESTKEYYFILFSVFFPTILSVIYSAFCSYYWTVSRHTKEISACSKLLLLNKEVKKSRAPRLRSNIEMYLMKEDRH